MLPRQPITVEETELSPQTRPMHRQSSRVRRHILDSDPEEPGTRTPIQSHRRSAGDNYSPGIGSYLKTRREN